MSENKAQSLLDLENELALTSFSNEDALSIGLAAVRYVKENKNRGVYIQIRRGETILFSYCMTDANEDNRLFAERKLRTVAMFEHSSLYAAEKYASKNRDFYDYYSPQEYQAKGGGFPIVILGTGMVGMIGVSGLSAEEDHEVCVNALSFFKKQKN